MKLFSKCSALTVLILVKVSDTSDSVDLWVVDFECLTFSEVSMDKLNKGTNETNTNAITESYKEANIAPMIIEDTLTILILSTVPPKLDAYLQSVPSLVESSPD